MDNWEKLEREIGLETRDYFQGKDIDIHELVDLLRRVLMARIDDEYKLSGVAVNVPKAMYDILDEDTTKKQRILNFAVLCKFETFLRKMLFLLKPQDFQRITDEKKGLAAVIKELSLNPNRISYRDDEANEQRDHFSYDYHLNKVYNLRNTESHEMELWRTRELDENIESLFIFYLEAVNMHKDELKEVLAEQQNDFTQYVNSIIQRFELLSKRFISTESVEDFSVFESYAVEHKSTASLEEAESERAGTVDNIRKSHLPEKRMLLWGDAGMGKSTTLQYLTYIDAKDYSEGQSSTIPVYVPLGMMINQEETLEQYICKELGVEYLAGIDLLKAGKVSLFLDGVNEISADASTGVQTRRLKEIQALMDQYSNSLIIVSNRPDSYSYFKGIPVFRLQKMDYKRIVEFLQKNTDDEQIRERIIESIQDNHRLLQIISTPLMATRLIAIVHELKELPKSEGTIIKLFLESLYKRERFEKKDTRFDEFKTHHLLVHLASYGFEKNGTNSGLSYQDVIECFAECMNKYHFLYDSSYALEILIALGVLSSDVNREVIVFSHQAYQDYYLSCSQKRISHDLQAPTTYVQLATQVLERPSIHNERESVSEQDCIAPKADQAEIVEAHTILSQDKSVQMAFEKYANDPDEEYYRKYARDARYEKSIIYKLHNSDRETRNRGIQLLAKHNALLAAKTISSGEVEPEIEEYVVDVAYNNINKDKTNNKTNLESILVFLELNRTKELRDCIAVLVDNSTSTHKALVGIVGELNSDQCIVFLDAVSQLCGVKDIKSVIPSIVNTIHLKEFEYTWNKDNLIQIRELTDRFNSIFIGYNLFQFYIVFNVPLELFVANYRSQMTEVARKHLNLVIEFATKYHIDFDTSPQNIIAIALKSNSNEGFLVACRVINSLDAEERYRILGIHVATSRRLRSVLFSRLSIADQYEFSKKHPFCRIYFNRSYLGKLNSISEEEAHRLIFDCNWSKYYHEDGKHRWQIDGFVAYLLSGNPDLAGKSVNEIVDSSSLNDYKHYSRLKPKQIMDRREKKNSK